MLLRSLDGRRGARTTVGTNRFCIASSPLSETSVTTERTQRLARRNSIHSSTLRTCFRRLCGTIESYTIPMPLLFCRGPTLVWICRNCADRVRSRKGRWRRPKAMSSSSSSYSRNWSIMIGHVTRAGVAACSGGRSGGRADRIRSIIYSVFISTTRGTFAGQG